MNLTCQQDELARALALVARAANFKIKSLPILACVRLSADDRLRIAATNLEISIEAEVPANVVTAGEVCVSARELEQFIHRLPAGAIEMELTDTVFVIRLGKTQVKLPTWSTSDFPNLPQPVTDYEMRLPAADFLDVLKRVLISTKNDDNDPRPFIKSIYLHIKDDNQLLFASTDINRFSIDTLPVESPPGLSLLLPSRAAQEIRTVFGDTEHITIQADKKLLAVIGDGVVLISRPYDGVFPNYEHIFPSHFVAEMSILRQLLTQSLERALIISDHYVKLSITPGQPLHITASDNSQEYFDEVPAEITGESEIELVFSPKQLLDWLKVIETDEIHVGFVGSTERALFTVPDSAYKHIIMPYEK